MFFLYILNMTINLKLMMMRRILTTTIFLGVCLIIGNSVYARDAFPPGSKLPPFSIQMPDTPSPEINTYLKVKDGENFSLSQIPARLIVVEFLSVFCAQCQVGVPTFNKLYRIMKEDQDLNKDVKMVGIALLSKADQVVLFKEKFKVRYPLFADPQDDIQTRTKIYYVPLTLVIDKNNTVLMRHWGKIDDMDAFLIELRRHLKYQQVQ